MASLQERLATFNAVPKSRRGSRGTRKTAQNATGWPLESPTPADLAYAGFVWKPGTETPDNVQCIVCHCQLDGWEPSDIPAYEHLTHAPDCGFAINICIRLRNGDPNRVEQDPMSAVMQNARRATFGDKWPLDTNAGFPSVDQVSFSVALLSVFAY